MKISSQHLDAKKQLDNLLINYTKGSYDVDIETITRLAMETNFDIYADLTPENYRIYFEHLLNGPKNEDHYGELATYLYDRGHMDEGIDYLNVGIARLGAERVSEFIHFLKEEFWIGKLILAVIHTLRIKFAKQLIVTQISSLRARQEPAKNWQLI